MTRLYPERVFLVPRFMIGWRSIRRLKFAFGLLPNNEGV